MANTISSVAGAMRCHILRMHPGMEVFSTLQEYVQQHELRSAFVVTAVGSVTKATLRFAHNPKTGNAIKTISEHMEIVSLVGTISAGSHLHISLSDVEGNVIGGHVIGDLIVFTTCEVVIGTCEGVEMLRPFDSATGFPELALEKIPDLDQQRKGLCSSEKRM